MNVLIVDDEEPARMELRSLLKDIPGLCIVGEASNGKDAVRQVFLLKPDVVFLDIQMPQSGLEAARAICRMSMQPYIIFVTAYDNYALETYEFHAADYLLKPINEVRLLKTIDWISNKITKENLVKEKLTKEKLTKETSIKDGECKELNRILLENKGRYIMIDLADVYYCYSENEKVFVKTREGLLNSVYSLKKLEEKLNGCFFRCHRKYIINLQHVYEISPWFNGTYTLVLKDHEKTEIPVSRKKAHELRKKLGLK
jgi:DNA-binding LytR/AlgR family response regulator